MALKPFLRGFDIRPAENGGWLLLDEHEPMMRANTLGAFSNSDDLLAFLTERLRAPANSASEGGE